MSIRHACCAVCRRLDRIEQRLIALPHYLPWNRHRLMRSIEMFVRRDSDDKLPYIRRVKWARDLTGMCLVEAKRFVNRCYGERKREAPDA